MEKSDTSEKHYFYGQPVSDYGVKNNRIDYLAFASTFDAVLCLYADKLLDKFNWEVVQGELEQEVFQWFVIDTAGVDRITTHTPSEILIYIPDLDMHLWGVTHWGTGWDYVLTEINIADFEKPLYE